MCEDCGAESIAARLPSGRHIELDMDDTWVGADEHWPDARLFTVIHKSAPGHPELDYAKPVISLMDRLHGRPSGPFHREHLCP
jgi:hypothetical protein